MTYKHIDFSVADNRDGTWRWKLHPKIELNVWRTVPRGQVTGKQPDVIRGANVAIDDWLALVNYPK